jgi:hypothetical protein
MVRASSPTTSGELESCVLEAVQAAEAADELLDKAKLEYGRRQSDEFADD